MKPVYIKTAFTFLVPVIFLASAHSQITLTGNDYLSKPAGIVVDNIKVEGLFSPSGLGGIANNNKVRTYKYVDGFGRPLQSIVEGASPNGKDLIQFSIYDEFGRSTKQYLPFEFPSVSSGTPYQDRGAALINQANFYTTNTTANKITNDSKPWVQADVEQSPMQRLVKQGNVGDGFQPDQHYKSGSYRVNDANDAVRKWAADGTSSGTYSANDLSVTEGTNENGVKGIVFADKLGRTILKRQQADETIGGTNYPFFDTYYVYDLLGNVAYVIPPKAVVKLTSVGGTWNITSVPNLIFSYKYDNKNRVTEKKVPGADVTYLVYDPLDRVVLAQSGNMRVSNTWFYSKYDANGRVITEGVYTDNTNTTLAGMQNHLNGQSCYGSSSTTYYEEKTSSTSSFYTNNCFPTGGTEERLYYYYDNYDMNDDGNADYSYTAQALPGESTATDKTTGLPTIVNKKVLGSSYWLMSITFYDKHYNVIQVTGNNLLGLVNIAPHKSTVTNVVDFGGRLNERKEYHAFNKTTSLTIRNSYSYDKMNRLTEVQQGHDGGSMIIVGRYEYNSLGQLVDKKLHSANGGNSFLQSVDYRYNIRGQLTSINNSSLSNDGGATNDESNDVWGMNLFYEKEDNATDVVIGNTPNWTGMLSAVKWKANIPGGNNDERAYLFTYDKLYRLSAASYKANTGSAWTKDANGYNETISYDWNGNILTMKRKSVISGSVTDIDDMVYDYGTSNDNNKLLNMAENSSNSYGYRNFTSSSNGYSYDANGNLAADAKKGIAITYNEMNKPVIISQDLTFNRVLFAYDAAGVRVSKTVTLNGNTTTEYYIAGLVVQSNNTVKHFAMAEGRVRNNSGTLVYEYFITDQQGNVRVSFEDNNGTAVARQENSYYPFGMPMAGNYMPTDANKKLYNAGSEWQDDFGGIIDYYSTFFREYDPVIGRFNGVDSKADLTLSLSIYHYAGNNPVNFNDPMGDETASNFANFWNNLINYFFSDSYKGPSFNYNFETNNYEEISKGRAEIMLRELGVFVSDFNEIAEEVRQLISDKNYKAAMDKITQFFKSDFGTPSRYYQYYFNPDPNPVPWETYYAENAYGEQILEISVPITALERFVQGNATFGEIVRSLYHEHIHVKQRSGLEGWGDQLKYDQAEREFTANYLSIMNTRLPAYSSKDEYFYLKYTILKQYYQAMVPAKQEYYKGWYNQLMTMYTAHLFNNMIEYLNKK